MINASKIDFYTKETDFVKVYGAKLNIESTIRLNKNTDDDAVFKEQVRKKLTASIFSEIYSVQDVTLLARCVPFLRVYCEHLETESTIRHRRRVISAEQQSIEDLLSSIIERLE